MRSVIFSQYRDCMMGVMGLGLGALSTCKTVLDLLEPDDLRLG